MEEKNKNEEYNIRHLNLYDFALLLVEKLMQDYLNDFEDTETLEKKAKPQALDSICNCISKAQKGQRLALRMDDEIENNELPQVNIIRSKKDMNI